MKLQIYTSSTIKDVIFINIEILLKEKLKNIYILVFYFFYAFCLNVANILDRFEIFILCEGTT